MNDRHEHYQERKLELGLAETLGAEQPPDMSKRVLAAADSSEQPVLPGQSAPRTGKWRTWLAFAVAISLLFVLAAIVVSVDWRGDPTARTVADAEFPDVESQSGPDPTFAKNPRWHEAAEEASNPFRVDSPDDAADLPAEFGAYPGISSPPPSTPGRVTGPDTAGEKWFDENSATDGTIGDLASNLGRDMQDFGPATDPAVTSVIPVPTQPAPQEPPVREPLGETSSGGGDLAEPTHLGPVHGKDFEGDPSASVEGLAQTEVTRRPRSAPADAQPVDPSDEFDHLQVRRREYVQEIERLAMREKEIQSQSEVSAGDEGRGSAPVSGGSGGGSADPLEVATLTDNARRERDRLERVEERINDFTRGAPKTSDGPVTGEPSVEAPAERIPPSVDGQVTGVNASGQVELSLGTDDGLRKGQSLEIFNAREHVGRIKITETSPDRSRGEIVPGFEGGDIRKGNRLSTVLRSSDSKQPKKTWRRAQASPNAARLVIGDHDELLPAGLQANVVVDGFRARVLLDCYYFNNRGRRLEGSFKLRLPNDASLYYLAFGTTSLEYRPQGDQLASRGFIPPDLLRSTGTGPQEILRVRQSTWDKVKEARLVPRQKAAHAYSETVRRRVDPALAEWTGAGVFQCRVFPLEPNKLHRIVVGYDVNLVEDGDDLIYKFDVPYGLPECAVDMNVTALPGTEAEITPQTRPFVSGGRAFYHFEKPSAETINLRLKTPETVLLTGTDNAAGEFFTTRVRPDLPDSKEKGGSSHAVFLVDTSLSSRPEKFNTYLDLLASMLENNRDSLDMFSVLLFNIESHWWQEGYAKNTPENVKKLIDDCHTLSLEGATDLKQALAEAVQPQWQKGNAKDLPKPDLFLLSDGAITWGEDNLHLLGKSLGADDGGSLFAYKVGTSGVASHVLEHLARETGGAVFSIANDEEVAAASTAHRHRPWVLLDASVDGGDDVLVAGRPRTVYPDQLLTVVGRGTPQPGAEFVLKARRGDQLKTLRVPLVQVVTSELAPRAYGQVAVGQLEDLMPATEETSVAFARHFRVAGRSCSLLMLDSEADYQRFQIKPEDDAFVVRSFPAADLVARVIDETSARRTDPKAAVVDWLDRLQKTPGVTLNLSTATKLALEKMPPRVFEVDVPRLDCRSRSRNDLPEEFVQLLSAVQLDYDAIDAEAQRRLAGGSTGDALKALSCLIERNPGDMVLLRDVAFSAMEWGLGGQAYPLLRRVALARPYQPPVYTAMARCLADLGHADLAMVYFEVALAGRWSGRYLDFGKIARFEYGHLLQQIEAGKLECCVPEFARARLASLQRELGGSSYDLAVMMEWNTDRTDVDLHVREPSGETCFFEHKTTRSGGRITDDVTEGFGPELYTLQNAPTGKYTVKANYFGGDQNRTSARTKVYVTVFRKFGTPDVRVQRHTVTLNRTKDQREVTTVGVGS